ncbi:MAG: hypothetical protein R3F04_07980 [Lysobacteraceae bacterium]
MQPSTAIRRSDVAELCHLGPSQAVNLLKQLKAEGKLVQHVVRRWAYYTLGENVAV